MSVTVVRTRRNSSRNNGCSINLTKAYADHEEKRAPNEARWHWRRGYKGCTLVAQRQDIGHTMRAPESSLNYGPTFFCTQTLRSIRVPVVKSGPGDRKFCSHAHWRAQPPVLATACGVCLSLPGISCCREQPSLAAISQRSEYRAPRPCAPRPCTSKPRMRQAEWRGQRQRCADLRIAGRRRATLGTTGKQARGPKRRAAVGQSRTRLANSQRGGRVLGQSWRHSASRNVARRAIGASPRSTWPGW